MKPKLHVVFSGGGTGGHLYPGIAVSDELRKAAGVRITFAGSGAEFEAREVAAAGFDYLPLACRPLPSTPRGAWRFFQDHLRGARAARRFLREEQVGVVVGLGGYASVPTARAAVARRIPLVLLEQNAIPGRATRWLAPRAALVCAAFHEIRPRLACGGPLRVTGNPVRSGFAARDFAARESKGAAPRQLLVCGGSGGARTLNEQLPRALYKLRDSLSGWRILHQAGPRGAAATRSLYDKLGVAAEVVPFLHDMPSAMRESDLAVCRAGGTTLAELSASGLPAVLVPYPRATNDHQRRNADVFTALGGCALVDERAVAGRFDDALAAELESLLADDGRRRSMAAAMHRRARPDAAWQIARMVRELGLAEVAAPAA